MVVKFVNGSNSSPNCLRKIIDYVSDPTKTNPDLCGGYCCDKNNPFEDMMTTKRLHRKASGKMYEHIVIAFDPQDDLEPTQAVKALNEIAQHYNGHQAFFAIHNNTDNLHGHLILNSLAAGGQKFSQWKPKLALFKNYIQSVVCPKFRIAPVRQTMGSKPVGFDEGLELNDLFKLMRNERNDNFMNEDQVYPCEVMESCFDTDDDQDYFESLSNVRSISIGDRINIAASTTDECISILEKLQPHVHTYCSEMSSEQIDSICRNSRFNLSIGTSYNVYATGNLKKFSKFYDDDDDDCDDYDDDYDEDYDDD